VFSFRRLSAQAIEKRIAEAGASPRREARFLTIGDESTSPRAPFLFAHDVSISVLGQGETAFALAREAFNRWTMFDLGWVRVANPQARIAANQLVAVESRTLRLWTVNISRIVTTVDTPLRFGFIYVTTDLHVEEGEERFLLQLEPETQSVTYKIEAFSRPRSNLARLGLPIARMFQGRFRQDSHGRMRTVVEAWRS
jgi:uncharacterized protein (UPF0548 family)